MSASASGQLEIGGRRLTIRNLDRVVFLRTGTTKGELLDYYVRIGDVMLPHLRERLLHMHRYPEGVEGPRRCGAATRTPTSSTASSTSSPACCGR